MSLTVQRINPLDYGDQLKSLFLAHARPEFPAWYDRAYPTAVAEGAASWVLVEPEGRVVGHVAGFTARLSVEGREATGTLLANLMVDQAHRTFFPAVAMLKGAVKDLRAAGTEFIYTNPNNPGAIASMRAAGLKPIGDTNRFLMLLGHSNPFIDRAVAAIHALNRLSLARVDAEETSLDDAVRWTTEELCAVSPVTPRRRPTVYPMRMEDFGGPLDLGVRLTARGRGQVGAAIIRIPPEAPDAYLVTMRCRTQHDIASCATAVGALLRARGVRRLDASALMGTGRARGLERGGLVCRKEPWTVSAVGYSELGRAAISGLGRSDIEKIDLD